MAEAGFFLPTFNDGNAYYLLVGDAKGRKESKMINIVSFALVSNQCY